VPHTLFISDLHLDSARPHVTAALARFLDSHRDCDALYILGDIFEAWLGDDDDSLLAQEVADLLTDFTRAGSTLYLMRGNRDFLLGRDFSTRVGAHLLDDPTVVNLYGTPTLLMHGDSLCTQDTDYQAFRKMAQDPAWQETLLAKSLAQRKAIAQQLRTVSKEAGSNKAEDIMDVTPAAVTEHMRQFGVQRLIHGHTHRPQRHSTDAGTRWVLGDWDTQGWALNVSDTHENLYNFDI
jgi:UDP-2,3-diacylglucosamine hydrolase